jgi:predicted nucleotidyltransferase component of viral defense system
VGATHTHMNNIIANYEQIQAFARGYGLPLIKTRAIIREYLQSMILEKWYRNNASKQYAFVGGTSLRLLYGLDRFSEDLDFDVLDTSSDERIIELMQTLSDTLTKENIPHVLYQNTTPARAYFELRFPELLYELKISSHESEKLVIKLDFERFWKGIKPTVKVLDRYGFLAHIVVPTHDELLVQKLYTYIHRKQTLARDLYDIVWLISHGALLDLELMKRNDIKADIVQKVLEKYTKEKKKLPMYARRLQPFLLEEDAGRKLDFFPDMIDKIISSTVG